jgi:serine phosphatase RsbU (regulator of sigma subunit)
MQASPEAGLGGAGFSVPNGFESLQLQRLAQVTGELGATQDMAGFIDVAVTHIAAAVGAATATLLIREGDQLVMAGGHGLQPGTDLRWATFGVNDLNPASEAARTGRPVLLGSPAEVAERYPVLASWMPAGRSLLTLPLGRGAWPAGSIGLTFEDGWLPEAAELDFLLTFADACGQAVRRIQASERASEAAQKLTFLAMASAELAGSLDYRTTLRRVAQLTVPTLADWCAVQIVEDGQLQTLAVAHADPDKVAWAWELERRYPPLQDAPTGAPNVLRTGVSELYETITDEMIEAGARDEDHLRLSRELNLRSAMIVPLSTRGRTLGVIMLIRAESDHSYQPADLSVAEDLGRRAAMSIDNARLHSQTEGIALQLQRAVLPAELDHLPGWQIATHYGPAGPADVGGDFYDAIEDGDGGLSVFIGDVMGRGIGAAAAMAQMRAAVRAYVCIDPDPQTVVGRLDRMIARLGLTELATLLYAHIDPALGQVHVVSAGHLPPVIVSAVGEARWLDVPAQRPLGLECVGRPATTAVLARGDTLLLYTDGLVERREEPLDDGLERLAKRAGVLAGANLAGGLSALIEAIDQAPGADDVTALAVRYVG